MIATLSGPGFWAGFRAAAYLHNIDGFRRQPLAEVVGPRSCRRIRGLDVIQHWVEPLDADDLTYIDGIPCTSFARTVVDVCGVVEGDLAAAGRRRLRTATGEPQLAAAHGRTSPPTGAVRHRNGVPPARPPAARRTRVRTRGSSGSSSVVSKCRGYRRGSASTRSATRTGVSSLVSTSPVRTCCTGSKPTVESSTSGSAPESIDQRRENLCTALGWQISYVGWYDTESPATVAKTIEAIARRRAAQLGVTAFGVA